ncbi:MAG: YidC/Oxa1 family membrane protein insertase, partial [Clostridiales bacterium]|nr:YidC/Oxa1 family membrane protein insertase [Clostridiales bacterium]
MSFLTAYIDKDPGVIMGPIDAFLGYILDFIFNIIYRITEPNSLGITIIIFTCMVRSLMVPSGIKMQRSSIIMRKLAPDVAKIKEKYSGADQKDPEIQRKIAAETQALYAKNNYNILGGCLPMFITFPIFMALNYLLRQPFMFIDKVGVIYEALALKIFQVPDIMEVLTPIRDAHLQGKMEVDITLVSGLMKVLNKMTSLEWVEFMKSAPMISNPELAAEIQAMVTEKQNFETFLGLNLLNSSGWAFPGILIPLLSAGTQFGQAFYNYKVFPPQDASTKNTQL